MKPRILVPTSLFLTGASVLIVEVAGVRVLSTFYGNTIFTVSSVISVILLALSCGYYAGGKLADRKTSLQLFFELILTSGLVLLVLYILGTVVLPILSSRLSISTGPLVSAVILFLLPAILLGMLSPYAIKLQTVLNPGQGVGAISGSIFFWSTLGSIAGSLAAGFVFIPHFGIDRLLIANGVLVSLLGLTPILLMRAARGRIIAALVAFAFAAGGACFAAAYATRHVLYTRDGVYQKLTIYDGTYAGRPTRFLQQDENNAGAGEGAMFLDSDDPKDLVYDYTRYYSLYKILNPNVRNALVIGGGAYSVPKALLRELPTARVDVVDIEPSLFSLAQQYFKVSETAQLHSYVEDGRRFLRNTNKKYDLIFSDVYYSFFSVPPHFGTREFFELAKDRLSPNGILIVNMIGDLSRRKPSLILSEIRTFETVFPNSYFFAVAWPERTDSQNVMLVGSNSANRVNLNAPDVLGNPERVIHGLSSKQIDVARRFELSAYALLTDNYSPIEYLTAQVLRRAFASSEGADGDEMAADVDQQIRYGSRSIGSPGYVSEKEFLLAEMGLLAEEVKTQSWDYDPRDERHGGTNVIGRFYTADRRVVIATRYDSGASGSIAVSGDESGASGVAVMVELARAFEDLNVPPGVGIDFVFFDGNGRGSGHGNPQFETGGGSQTGLSYFAEHLSEIYGPNKPLGAIVLNGVCDGRLHVLSSQSVSPVFAGFWKAAQEADRKLFTDSGGPVSGGDAEVLIRAGIPTVTVTNSLAPRSVVRNTSRACSAPTLAAVGKAILQYVTAVSQ
ncbi:MAG TPA: fused MFS/spermidine synthase [Candidatus Acidoferrales bacterium]|nr:fused MFS/spermidine synthase [Candidatus Acidoferrales bacterium]